MYVVLHYKLRFILNLEPFDVELPEVNSWPPANLKGLCLQLVCLFIVVSCFPRFDWEVFLEILEGHDSVFYKQV